MKTLIVILMIITAIIVIAGVILMAVRNKGNRKYSNKLMLWRLFFQGIVILLIYMLYSK